MDSLKRKLEKDVGSGEGGSRSLGGVHGSLRLGVMHISALSDRSLIETSSRASQPSISETSVGWYMPWTLHLLREREAIPELRFRRRAPRSSRTARPTASTICASCRTGRTHGRSGVTSPEVRGLQRFPRETFLDRVSLPLFLAKNIILELLGPFLRRSGRHRWACRCAKGGELAVRVLLRRPSEENVSLIREINDLRREINALKHERQAQDDRTSTCEQPRWGAGVGVASRRGGCGIQLVWLVPSIPGPPCGSTGWSHHNQVARSFGATYRKRGGFAPDY